MVHTVEHVRVARFEVTEINDPNRVAVTAEVVARGVASDEVAATITTRVWIGDDPTFQVLQLRVLHATSQAFALSEQSQNRIKIAAHGGPRVSEGFQAI
jgi:hypothetical protein